MVHRHLVSCQLAPCILDPNLTWKKFDENGLFMESFEMAYLYSLIFGWIKFNRFSPESSKTSPVGLRVQEGEKNGPSVSEKNNT